MDGNTMERVKKMIAFFARKWIKGKCPHVCLFCQFRKEHFNECFSGITREESDDE